MRAEQRKGGANAHSARLVADRPQTQLSVDTSPVRQETDGREAGGNEWPRMGGLTCAGEQLREHPREFWILWAAEVPERGRIHRLIEAKDFFDASVAIGGDDQVLPGQAWLGVGHSDHHVVMEFALLMVREQVERAPVSAYRIKQRSEHALVGERFHNCLGCC